MSRTDLRQRLAAILAADVAGYSRLMASDELRTIEALDAARAIFEQHVESHHGRVVDTAGDSVLAIFETAVGAVDAALAVQRQLESAALALPSERRMRFRVGVHLGDVVEKNDGTVYGDGVNVAARLQTLAVPGGIAVSAAVHDAVRDRVPVAFEDRGEHAVKNIARPVHVFQVEVGARSAVATVSRKLLVSARRRWRLAAIAALLLCAVAGVWIASADSAKPTRDWLATRLERTAAQTSIDRASVAVLPFVNQSGDEKREYFSDGITEDIIHALGRFSGLVIISSNAVRPYKGRQPTFADISRELGVRYIAQGSVREAEGRLRVAIELSDAQRGVQLWSQRYEGAGADVFAIQDRIARDIVGALAVKLTAIEQQRVVAKPSHSLETYDLVLKARSLLNESARKANREARELLQRAQKIEPDYADIHTSLCFAEFQRATYGWVEDAQDATRRAEEHCKRALGSPDQLAHARAHAMISVIYNHVGREDEALSHAQRALELNPSDATVLSRLGFSLVVAGRLEEAIVTLESALRYDPQPHAGDCAHLAAAYYGAGRFRQALAFADACLARMRDVAALHAIRAATLAQLGNAGEARRAAEQVRRLSPGFEVENFGTRYKTFGAQLRDGLRKAGL